MHTTTVIIGAGQAGLTMSRCLTDLSVDHVLLERGSVANSWRTERWDSLRLLTPNWLSRLPNHRYTGSDPEGYMRAEQVADYLESYRHSFDAPVIENTNVTAVETAEDGYEVITDQGRWSTRAVVVAAGGASTPLRPPISAELPSSIRQVAPIDYRNPGQIEKGRVLIVGASASGIQLAEELAMAGFDVTLAVGNHIRMPRTYRGLDTHWWMDTIGLFDDRYDEVDDLDKARRLPSAQLIGSDDRRMLDLNAVSALGVEVVGRLAGATRSGLQFSGSLANHCVSADLKQHRLLDAIDDYVAANGLQSEVGEPLRPPRTALPIARTHIDYSEFGTVIWATGYRPYYPWLESHLLDRKGGIVHDGGEMSQAGMYVLGLKFLRTRRSSFIDGVGADARFLSARLCAHLGGVDSVGHRVSS